ncbi:exodeoxyribonuclease VII large subunit [Salipaludibacillus aurantiacus]|uniref:Exodeoxyribonuclease 7 large subunit n=1 Tax=Salipaludibacillus aurantiacus TaxID=1601833 RepID=A0A1H9PM70_9BACI|nr:exodeoxyribonuclease VII large subunit [Salipaludibacillus aurantiacus]SER48889.1 exodeoxyribonuclease VII large subunit [Salipaludibacillus aurantiacus]
MNHNFLTVSDLTQKIKHLLDREPGIQNVWIRAEISNFKRHSRGHMYFTLKDQKSRVQSVMFAGNNRFLKFLPEDGMRVLVRGDISVYEPYGQYQFYVKEMQPDGIGNLYLAFEKLKKKLEMAGYFAKEKKKQVPAVPNSIAVITSPTGAAVRDIITTLKRRYPLAKVTLLPVLVQGPDAPGSIARAIRQANEAGRFDVIISGRGGGSLEELWAFNEEVVAEAIFRSELPIISAVGHETDITISDFVADLRAPTPTAAAELAVPDIKELLTHVYERKVRLTRAMKTLMNQQKERLSFLTRSYAFRYPKQLLEQKEQDLDRVHEALVRESGRLLDKKKDQLDRLNQRLISLHPQDRVRQEAKQLSQLEEALKRGVSEQIKEQKHRLSLQISKLDVLSPLKIMERGYSLVYNEENQLVKHINQAPVHSRLSVQLADGKLQCEVKSQSPGKNLNDGGIVNE